MVADNLAAAKRAPSLADTVDERHLRDIRRVLRRKYASRTNLHRIFAQWDKGDKGGISPEDLFNGLNKIGIAATLDEAAALHGAATQTDADPNLSLQEFSDLLFSGDETLNVALKDLPPMDKTVEAGLAEGLRNSMGNRTIDLQALDRGSLDKLRLRNQWRACLQRNLQNITKDLLALDADKTYTADPRDLMKVLEKRANMSTAMKYDQEKRAELHEYLTMFQDEQSGRIRYTDMALDLRSFNYDQETNEGILPKTPNSISSGRRSFFGAAVAKNVFNDDYVVLDSQQVPANKLDAIERHLQRVNRHLQDKFGTREKFETYLREKVDADKNGNISVDEFKVLIKDTLTDEVVKRRLTKRDLEGFLSAFKYNKHGATDIGSIAPLVFERDANKLTLALNARARTNPPPAFVNGELREVDGAAIQDEAQARRLRGLLEKVEDVAFSGGKPKTFEIFRNFDVDGDGYVSYKDFENHLIKNKVFASQEDIASLMKHVLDTDGNGYIDFSTFKEKFGPSMSKLVEVPERELHLPNLAPSKEKLDEYGQRARTFRTSFDQVRKGFAPEVDASKYFALANLT